MVQALAAEAEFPADIVLWHGRIADGDRPIAVAMLSAAGDRVIGDAAPAGTRRRAA